MDVMNSVTTALLEYHPFTSNVLLECIGILHTRGISRGISQVSRNQSGLLNWHICQFSKPDWFLEICEAPGMYIYTHVHTLTCPHTTIHYHIYIIKCCGSYFTLV